MRLPNWVGDVVMATPALRALRRAYPGAEFVYEGRPFLRGLLGGLGWFDGWRDERKGGAKELLARARELRGQGFDLAVLLPDSHGAVLGPFLARVPRRVGYDRSPVRRWFLTDSLPQPSEAGKVVPVPMIERYLRLTRLLGCADAGDEMELAVEPADDASLGDKLAALGWDGKGELLLVTPGANFGSSKLWPPEHFAATCDELQRRHGLVPVIAPGPPEIEIARAVAAAMETPALVLGDPVTSLGELKALIARSRLVLSNDTGPRAMAVALKKPVVVLMGPTDPRYTAMHLERQRVLREDVDCSPCHLKICPIDHRCMQWLKPARAVAAAEELLA